MTNIKLAGLEIHTAAIHVKGKHAMLRYNSRYTEATEAMLHTFQTPVQNECENQACTWGRQLLILTSTGYNMMLKGEMKIPLPKNDDYTGSILSLQNAAIS
jgi:hypothetical protein